MPRRQLGQGAVEFLLAATPVLLIALGSIEAVHWYFARQAVSLALTQAARAAITQHADPVVLDQAFALALLPLYAGPAPAVSESRLRKALEKRQHDTGLPAWNITMLSPSDSTFADFASQSPDLPHHGRAVIDNDYLHEQHEARAEARGPLSGQTTLEANTLVLHLTWLHKPLLPGVKQLLRQIAPTDDRYGSLAMARAGYLPLQRQVALVMQSHPIAWDMPAHGRIRRAVHPGATHPGQWHMADPPGPGEQGPPTLPSGSDSAPPAVSAETVPGDAQPPACTGLWCLRDFNEGNGTGQSDPADTSSGQTPATGAQPPGNPVNLDDVAYRGAEPETGPDAAAFVPDDCPGCCA